MNCKKGTQNMAAQIEQLLNTIDDKTYARALDIFNGTSIGQHIRHILNFYTCINHGMESGLIDYSRRDRNSKIEQDKAYAQALLAKEVNRACKYEPSSLIQVKADFSAHCDDNRPLVDSSLGRELLFAYDHAVHHLAIIKIGIQATFPEVQLEKNFGVAPATVKHRAGGNAA